MEQLKRLLGNVGAAASVLIWIFPIYWVALTTIKPVQEIMSPTPIFIFKPTLDHFRNVFEAYEFGYVLFNSLFIVAAATFISMILSLLAAYGLVVFNLKRRELIALTILSLRFLPAVALAVPYYVLFQGLGVLDTHFVMIIVYIGFSIPFALFLLYGFLKEVPPELIHAAMLDGYGHLTILRKIVIPISGPGIAVTAMFTFIFAWNEFLLALFLTDSVATTIPVSVSRFVQSYQVLWGEISAAGLMAIVPMLGLVFYLQKYIVRGLTFGAVK
jgi:multiple sugar transport system permease protein